MLEGEEPVAEMKEEEVVETDVEVKEVEVEGEVVLSRGVPGVEVEVEVEECKCVSGVRCVGTAVLRRESRTPSSIGYVTHPSTSAASSDSVLHAGTSQKHKIECLLIGRCTPLPLTVRSADIILLFFLSISRTHSVILKTSPEGRDLCTITQSK